MDVLKHNGRLPHFERGPGIMPLFYFPLTFGTGGGAGPAPGGGAESWVHPEYSRPLRVKPLGARNERGAFSGRVRSDDPNLDTFFDE